VATLGWLAASPARFVVVNLEDLWGELEPVNVPGVTSRPNWRRRAARTLEQLRRDEAVASILRRVDAARSGTAPRAGEDAA
jgi:4-alpha-glucanotransferase